MVNVAARGGGGYRPVHHAAPHRGRPAPEHRAVFLAFRSGGPKLPDIPRKYRPKPKPHPTPKAPPLRLPTLGKLGPKPVGQTAIPFGAANVQAALQQAKTRASIPHPVAAIPVYANPLRGISGLTPERIDQGVDYAGTGPIYAPGPGIITRTGLGPNTGWSASSGGVDPGGYVAEKLSAGPAKGQIVYFAEGIYPSVQTGQVVGTRTKIANMVAAIETGFASGAGTESMASATGETAGPTSTAWGKAWSDVLGALGAPRGIVQSGGVGPGNVPDFARGLKPGGKMLQPRVTLPPAPLPNTTPHGVNPPASGGVNLGPVDFMAFDTTIRRRGGGGGSPPPTRDVFPPFRRHGPGTGGPPTRQPGGPTPTGAGGRGPGPTVTTITSSRGKGGILSFAAPSTGASSGGGMSTLLLVAGAGVVLVLLFMRKGKGKGKR